MTAKILLIDDEEAIRLSLRGILEDEGYTVIEAGSAEEGIAMIDSESPDLAFLDVWLPGMDGLEAQKLLHTSHPELPVVVISGHGTIETAVTAIQHGAYDFIEKPLSLDKVLIVTRRALEAGTLRRENALLRTQTSPKQNTIIATSAPMLRFLSTLEHVAPTDAWVLLTGENGTGKELAAHALHDGSKRASEPFIAVNCAAIPEELIESELFGHEKGAFTGSESTRLGRFELANKGTLFLDEIGDMSLRTQAKILRILQEQCFERVGGSRTVKVNVRVIAATNKNLEEAIEQGQFRKDLYYRLRVVPLHLPPLRERSGDVRPLLATFLADQGSTYGITPPTFSEDALAALDAYAWPGNVRELRNFAERMGILFAGSVVTRADLPPEIAVAGPTASITPIEDEEALYGMDFKSARAAFEARYLAARLAECSGNITKLAELIGLERSYLHRKLKSFGLHAE
jgi:two-component system nitrogen regulation response regulator NtrX